MDKVYVNRAEWEGPPLAGLDGARVFNAPRPLFGDLDHEGSTWTGQFRRGTFYAAVWPGSYRADDMVARNDAHGAAEVTFVDNADVERLLAERLAGHGYTIDDYREAGLTVAQAAAEHGLPWHEGAGQ